MSYDKDEDKFEVLRCYVLECKKLLGIRKYANYTSHSVPGLMCMPCFTKKAEGKE